MGGANQSTCPAPSQSSTPRSSSNPIRFHENTQQGEVHFHDDKAGLKCAVENAIFFDRYHKWRPSMVGEFSMVGHDGSGGHSSVKMIPYIDDNGNMQVEMLVSKTSMGQTVHDLDKMASYP